MRRSVKYLLFTAAILALFLLLPLHAHYIQHHSGDEIKLQMTKLQRLHVTDLCLATEARYTRHLALADRHAPFQEHPLALEHFPSGSMILPHLLTRDTP